VTRALIQVNGVDGSNDNVPIATLVTLNNDGNGGELTYLWTIIDQPEGATDSLSSTVIQNPTFTPNKEGTYKLSLVVNQNLADESDTTAIVAVRQLKSFQRVPAATETFEDSAQTGWKHSVNQQLIELDSVQGDANRIVAYASASCALGMVVQFSGVQVIKSGLPGQTTVSQVAPLATGTIATGVSFGVIEASVAGGAIPSNLVYVRALGLVGHSFTGSPAVGDPVYVDATTSQPTLVASARQIGYAVQAGGGTYQFFTDGSRF
jgi:PKD domain